MSAGPLPERADAAVVVPIADAAVVPIADAPVRGVMFMVFASVSFATMNAVTAWMGREGVPWQTCAFARAFGGLLVAIVAARAQGASLHVRDRAAMWQRSLAGSVSMLCTFFALTHLPLSDATALLNTTPLWIALLAFVTLRERAGGAVIGALAVAAAGVLMIQRPSFSSGGGAGGIALAAGVFASISMVSLRRMRGETPEAVVVHFSAFASLVTGALLVVRVAQQGHPALDAQRVFGLVAIGATATLGQLMMTRAYALDRAARVGAASWLQVVFGLGIDALVFGRHIPGATLGGIGLVVCAGGLLVYDAHAQARRGAQARRVETVRVREPDPQRGTRSG